MAAVNYTGKEKNAAYSMQYARITDEELGDVLPILMEGDREKKSTSPTEKAKSEQWKVLKMGYPNSI
jgi:hypothetical protein